MGESIRRISALSPADAAGEEVAVMRNTTKPMPS